MKTVTKAQAEKMLKDKKIEVALFDQGYTILMPKKRAQKWLKALRSGEYIQDDGQLHSSVSGGFCCLGVEQYVNNGKVVENSFKSETCDLGEWANFPSHKYLEEAGMLYVNSWNNKSGDPYIKSEDECVSELNDEIGRVTRKINQHKTVTRSEHVNNFTKMASYLEKAMLVY
ncbi:hypothetical protein [Stenotrophomonas phage RAS14]